MSDKELINLTDDQIKTRIRESEQAIMDADKIIARGKALEKLKKTDEYKLVFEDGLYNDYAQSVFKEMTNPKQFAIIPLQDCEDTLLGIKTLKAYLGYENYSGIVETDTQTAMNRKEQAQSVLNTLG